jgi:drug/metabolite transporter (DMT)-like permease
MTVKWLRLAYVGEFLLALVAIFTAWSEIAGQAPLDLMYWAWKFGLGTALALAIVAYTDALVREEAIWTMRSARWLAMIVLLMLAMGALTFYYALQDEAGDSDDTSTISFNSVSGGGKPGQTRFFAGGLLRG